MAAHVAITFDTARFSARLARFVASQTREAEQVVFGVATTVLGDTVVGWPVDSGQSRAGWWGPRKVGPFHYQIGNPFRHSGIIEYGGWANPGPKTDRLPGERLSGGFAINPGVYARQKPSAPLRRALAKSYGEMGKQLKASMRQQWGR